ncbi:hypothetical protein SAMN06265371_1104 [Lutibacter agarilyticus]|uniref:DUF2953 domain-containing protein n=1 Tax=Lutibacter agarilyticus TaxID=1109740 RepID=A0A238YLS5_9FLAO|nr:hypothetical protein [Lutibacter agarilyticus]SNR72077.1 hypothetical protein SAMN06265371_1104 [Lutibacter agarilyticus]
MVLTGSILVFLLVVLYVLLMPIILFIDTDTNEYYVQVKGLAKASLEPIKIELLRVKLNVLFMTFYFYPLKYKWSKRNKKEQKSFNKQPVKFKKIVRILKSFKVKKMLLKIDTGDPILNVKLYAIFSLLNYSAGNFSVNFKNKNQLALHIENRPIDMIRSFIN